ncbi:MAG: hypothetical protein JWN52_2252 [Actinomycetia bacterium]|nr:hypothetical protein [Actinomycetes bacterium]
MLVMLAIFVTLAILTPFLGADSRDGLDWTPGHFWFRRDSAPGERRSARGRRRSLRSGRRAARETVRTPDSHGRTSAAPCAADAKHRRTVPAAG